MKVWLPTIKANSGSDVFTERLVDGLKKEGVDAYISWFNNYYEILPFLMKKSNLPERIDVIHTNSRNGFPFKGKSRKLVITMHSCIHDESCQKYKTKLQKIYHDLLIRKYETLSLEAADNITAVSNYVARKYKIIFPKYESVVIHNGIDTKYFRPDENQYRDNKFKLLFVGDPKKLKGFDLIRPIMERLGDGFTLSYTGGQKLDSNKIAHNMFNVGRLDQNALLRAYRRCDALLFPTRHEGFGYVVCEAMACGKPVITSDNSSLPELVEHNETGFLCETDDIDAFCKAAKILSVDRDKGRNMGIAGRKFVINNFSIDKMVGSYIRLYENRLGDTGHKKTLSTK